MTFKHFLSLLLLLSASFVSSEAGQQETSQSQTKPQSAAHTGKTKAQPTQGAVHEDEGQRIFDQNCSRCHTAPDGFSPRISGTVVRHMRVRASLSQHDEQELLRFLNP
ncbi:MAG TPA: cytochrome c [Acidobacteriaceae bacterium]|nr:cytochrome c [Acidobacteriaceae bacterium]